jgi:hypothetical protein
MSFTTLAERFTQRSKDIYGKFTPSSEQLIQITPDTTAGPLGAFGSKSRIKSDTRAVPVVSVIRDTTRLSKLLASTQGLLFLGKQQLLQTGNTFENTKILNPLSFVGNTVPFLHLRRHLNITQRTSGFLQSQTVTNVASGFTQTAAASGLAEKLKGLVRNQFGNPFTNEKTADKQIIGGWGGQRPEFSAFSTINLSDVANANRTPTATYSGPKLYKPQPLSQRGVPKTNLQVDDRYHSLTTAAERFRSKFYIDRRLVRPPRRIQRLYSSYIKDNSPTGGDTEATGIIPTVKSRFTQIVDPYNATPFISIANKIPQVTGGSGVVSPTDAVPGAVLSQNTISGIVPTENKINYDNILGGNVQPAEKTDIIKFTFKRVGLVDSNPVHFRALITAIKESIAPQFNDQRYVGRTERFVTYGGAKRTVDLTFNIAAFSATETDGMWTRINYLSGLAFPTGVQNGFMVPPLFYISIGGLYDNQPCYIENLDYTFMDESTTFDIDREVPFTTAVTMRISVLEKRTKFYDSPFYKIMEDAEKTITERQTTRRQNELISTGISGIRSNIVQNANRLSPTRAAQGTVSQPARLNVTMPGPLPRLDQQLKANIRSFDSFVNTPAARTSKQDDDVTNPPQPLDPQLCNEDATCIANVLAWNASLNL